MELVRSFQKNVYKMKGDPFRLCLALLHSKPFCNKSMSEVVEKARNEDDMPVEMENPFQKDKPKCILCKYDIEPNYRNVRLLSQFMSSYTGRVYGRHITGLCAYKQKKLEGEIQKAQIAGLLSTSEKNANFLSDPDLYDSSKPFRYL